MKTTEMFSVVFKLQCKCHYDFVLKEFFKNYNFYFDIFLNNLIETKNITTLKMLKPL